MKISVVMNRLPIAFLFIISIHLAGKSIAQSTLTKLWETTDSIPVPESVLPVPGKNELYVSLIDGNGNEKDGKGGVAILNKDGHVKNLNWVSGLNAPKGLGIYKNRLYVADITDVVVIDAKAGQILKTIPVPGAVFLNDITVDDKGVVYVSDTREKKVHRLINDVPELYLDNVGGANGLKAIGSDLYVLAGKELWKLDQHKNKTIIAAGFEQGGDGIEPVGNGDFIVTCWPGIIYYVKANGQFEKLLDVQGKMNTADLGYDAATQTLYVPTFNNYSVIAFKLTTKSYSNPLQVKFGDPYVLRVSDGKYYMYGTGGGAKKGFSAYSSDDLINWKAEGQVYFGNNKNGWGTGDYWAPEVYERKGKFYMFYSAQWKVNPTNEAENFKIGVAVADKPTGPFVDMQNKPIFDPGYPIIDANVLFAEDGKTYLYYSRCCYKHPVKSEVADWARKKGWFNEIEESWVYGIEMKPDFSGVTGKPVLLLRPPVKMSDRQAEWESRSVTSKEVNRRWTEGSYIFKKGDTYYMMYSANYFGGKNYAVGYATSKNPLGPFTKAANNPVLQKNTEAGGIVTGTGHNSITLAPDGKTMLCVYHGRTNKTGDERVVFIDKMKVSDNGILTVEGPTTEVQGMP